MIVADILGPWHRVEIAESEIEECRLPQFIHDVSDAMPWRDVTAQAAERIPPTPGLCVWRVWCSDAQLAQFESLPAYEVLRSATVAAQDNDPTGWPIQAAFEGTGEAAFATLPDAGWLEAGSIYLFDGTAYIVRQSHNRTEHDPGDVPALFMVHRMDATSLLAWVAGEQVYVGTRRTYAGNEYECLQAHVTETTWTPPQTPALWKLVVVEPPIGVWAVGVAYKIGDEVTYLSKLYRCRQAHTSIASWTPPAVLALWLPI